MSSTTSATHQYSSGAAAAAAAAAFSVFDPALISAAHQVRISCGFAKMKKKKFNHFFSSVFFLHGVNGGK